MIEDKDARIAELEARNKRIEDCLVHERTRVADLILRNEQLERKLAEQQAIITIYFKMFGKDSGSEELNNLLAKAKEEGRREAVPEGWQVVPMKPTCDMTTAFYGEPTMHWHAFFPDKYKAMLAAAPKPQGEIK